MRHKGTQRGVAVPPDSGRLSGGRGRHGDRRGRASGRGPGRGRGPSGGR